MHIGSNVWRVVGSIPTVSSKLQCELSLKILMDAYVKRRNKK